MYIKKFSKVTKNDVKQVGGKGASLGELLSAGLPVPEGFVVTTETFNEFSDQKLSDEVREQVLKAFDDLGAERVAVRSSAVAEDSTEASWAGQLESYLNVSRVDLIARLLDCWESIRSERALAYAQQNKIAEEELVVAVVVQKMVNSEAAGVMFTVNPISKNRDEMMIEACWGLGELLVQGMVTPDNYLVEKGTLGSGGDLGRTVNSQDLMLVFREGKNEEVSVPEEKKGRQILSEKEIEELVKLGEKIESHYGKPQDIEWAIEEDHIYIVQSRPITTL